jgi:DNA polymerase/3'-5' exonuclease PolX
MNTDFFEKITIKNQQNKYIIDEFIRYYKFIYSNYSTLNKPSKEIYYKLATIKKTIETIANYSKKLSSGNDISNIKGIGPKTVSRIDEIIKTGKLAEIIDIKQQYASIAELSSIYGIGPIKASVFYEKYGIKSINDLLNAYNNGKINLTYQMKLGIKYKDVLVEKIPHLLIKKAENDILNKIFSIDKNLIAVICGSYRRKKDFSSDLDILLTHPDITDNNNKQKYFLNLVVDVLYQYFIIDKLTEDFEKHFQGFASFKNIVNNFNHFNVKKNVVRLDIIIVPFNSFYTALLHFTGSAVFNQKLRLHAKSLNLKLSEYGLFKLTQNKEIPLKINSEKDIFDKLLLKFIPPEKR